MEPLTHLVVLTFPHTKRQLREHGTHLIGGRQTVCERVERRETHRPNRERHWETHKGFETHTERDTWRDVGCN